MNATKETIHGSPHDGQEHIVPFSVFPEGFQRQIVRNFVRSSDIAEMYIDTKVGPDSKPFMTALQKDNLRKEYNKHARNGSRIESERMIADLVGMLSGVEELRIVNRTTIVKDHAASLLAEAQEIFRATEK